jgi:hypothetical protein
LFGHLSLKVIGWPFGPSNCSPHSRRRSADWGPALLGQSTMIVNLLSGS